MIKKYTIDGISDTWLHQPGMMVYVETEYNEAVNTFMKEHYREIAEWCKNHELIFMYIPQFYKQVGWRALSYMIGKDASILPVDSTSIVLRYSLSEHSFSQIKGPSILFTAKTSDSLSSFLIDESDIKTSIQLILSNNQQEGMSSIEKELFVDNPIRFRVTAKPKEMDGFKMKREGSFAERIGGWINCILDESSEEIPEPKNLEEDDKIDNRLLQEALNAIVQLMRRGYSKETIWAMLEPMRELSPIHVTKDYHITLPLYHKEIELPPIQKAIYLLFLKYPQGIYFKELPDYETELYRIYRKLAVRGVNEKHVQSIKELVNPLSNSMNEKCSLIKKRVLAILDDNMAKHYYISGGKGELKRIDISPNLIIWE